MDHADWAAERARSLLEVPLPRRWAHVQGVAAQARSLAPILGGDAGLLEAAAWLHTSGTRPYLSTRASTHSMAPATSGTSSTPDPTLCSLVAHRSCAIIEAEERGLADELSREFPVPNPKLNDALAYCDMTTPPTGDVVSVHDRISEAVERYGSHNVPESNSKGFGHHSLGERSGLGEQFRVCPYCLPASAWGAALG